MKRVSDEFAFALQQPDLWTGLFFHDREEDGDIPGIRDVEWAALEAARPHLNASVSAWLHAAHAQLKEHTLKKRPDAKPWNRLRRAPFREKGEPTWRWVELQLSPGRTYWATVSFGFTDEFGDTIRPHASVWTQLQHSQKLQDLLRAPATLSAGVERHVHPQYATWALPTLKKGDRFRDIATDAAEMIWPVVDELCQYLYANRR